MCKITLSTSFTRNELYGNENKTNDHTQQFIYDEKQNSPYLFTCKWETIEWDSLGEFSNISYGVFGAEMKQYIVMYTVQNIYLLSCCTC